MDLKEYINKIVKSQEKFHNDKQKKCDCIFWFNRCPQYVSLKWVQIQAVIMLRWEQRQGYYLKEIWIVVLFIVFLIDVKQ